jgi:AcrR family transcriptional regulator
MSNITRKERERLARENAILDAAEIIFARDGYENTSMNAIAEAAEFSKRTLYQYFEDKNDLYLTVALRLYKSMASNYQELELADWNGYERIKRGFQAFYRFYQRSEGRFRIIHDIGKVRQLTDNPKLQMFFETDTLLAEGVKNNILLGQKDGSISKDLDALKTADALIFIMTGFLNQLSMTGDSFTRHKKIDLDEFSSKAIDMILSSLK